jgi:hypothetical protein
MVTKIIAYPKSGNTYLRFILANIFWPDNDFDFDLVRSYIPHFNSPEMDYKKECTPEIYVSHDHKLIDESTFVLVRHVGDVLESFYWHNKKFYNHDITFDEYLIQTDYGKDWREFIDRSIYIHRILRYEDIRNNISAVPEGLSSIHTLVAYLCAFSDFSWHETQNYYDFIDEAIKRSSFDNMRKIEDEKGLGELYKESNKNLNFVRSGNIGQWNNWDQDHIDKLLDKNSVQLQKLGYT